MTTWLYFGWWGHGRWGSPLTSGKLSKMPVHFSCATCRQKRTWGCSTPLGQEVFVGRALWLGRKRGRGGGGQLDTSGRSRIRTYHLMVYGRDSLIFAEERNQRNWIPRGKEPGQPVKLLLPPHLEGFLSVITPLEFLLY